METIGIIKAPKDATGFCALRVFLRLKEQELMLLLSDKNCSTWEFPKIGDLNIAI